MNAPSLEDVSDWLPKFPPEYLVLLEQNLIRFEPWHLLSPERAQLKLDGLQSRYPSRRLFAFAYRQDNDDLACWEDTKPGQVVIIHDHASAGWEGRAEYPSFWIWFRTAMEDMIDFHNT